MKASTILAGAPEGASFRFMGDEHGALIAKGHKFALGARITLAAPHCDPTVNLYDCYHVVEGEAVNGTLVTQDANTIEIEAEALSIPDHLSVSVEGAEIGTQFTAGSITLPSGVNLISDPDTLVVNVVAAPTAEDLEGEGAGISEAAEGEVAEEGEAAEESPAEESE